VVKKLVYLSTPEGVESVETRSFIIFNTSSVVVKRVITTTDVTVAIGV